MYQQLWSYDWFIFLLVLILSIVTLNFIYEREHNLKYLGATGLASQYTRTRISCLNLINYNFQNKFNYLFIYVFLLIFCTWGFFYGWGYLYISSQFFSNSTGWFYSFYIFLFSIILIWSFQSLTVQEFYLFDLRTALIILILLFTMYMYLNNYFIVLFLIECQGVVVIYLLGTTSNIKSVNNGYKLNTDIYQNIYKSQLYQLTSLFLNFWSAFISALFFVIVGIKLCYLYGAINWLDITYISYFLTLSSFYLDYNLLSMGIFMLAAIAIKIGIFPFHFWKPDLYKSIPLWTMLWYMSIYTFTFMFFIVIFFNHFGYILVSSWTYLIYSLQIISFLLLLNVLYIIVELKPFLAYMSVFHMLYILILLIMPSCLSTSLAVHYLLLYVVVTIHVFYALFIVYNNINYLTDLELLEQNLVVAAVFVISLAAVSGLPPFIGFWLKFSVILGLLTGGEFLLAIILLAGGLFLMYFYFQNYRFSGNLKFNWLGSILNIKINQLHLHIVVNVLLLLNFTYIFFMNDILNWNLLIGLLSV